jgi:hypothetical protein
MIDERIDGEQTLRWSRAQLTWLVRRVARASVPAALVEMEFQADDALSAVELDPLASDDASMLARQLHAEAIAAIARRREELCAR